jgi:hypothetical protein
MKLLLVAEVELPKGTRNPRRVALSQVEALEQSSDNITFREPAIGATTERAGRQSVEVFY